MTDFFRPGSASDLTKRLETVVRTDADGAVHSLKVKLTELQTALDEVSATEMYIGISQPGVTTAEAKWQIKKLTVSGGVTLIKFASGSNEFDKVWDSRAGYVY